MREWWSMMHRVGFMWNAKKGVQRRDSRSSHSHVHAMQWRAIRCHATRSRSTSAKNSAHANLQQLCIVRLQESRGYKADSGFVRQSTRDVYMQGEFIISISHRFYNTLKSSTRHLAFPFFFILLIAHPNIEISPETDDFRKLLLLPFH